MPGRKVSPSHGMLKFLRYIELEVQESVPGRPRLSIPKMGWVGHGEAGPYQSMFAISWGVTR